MAGDADLVLGARRSDRGAMSPHVRLANRALAQTEGRRAVTMLVEEDEGAFDWSRWLLTVLHEDGSCVLELPFQSVIDDLRPSHH